jgi:hypothetical protein
MLLDEMADRLDDEGLVASGYELRKGPMPASPDQVIVLRESGGPASDVTFDGQVVDRPVLQVVVRGGPNDYQSPRNAIETIFRAVVDDWGAFVVDGVRYLGLTALQTPFPLRVDENDRQELAVNFLVEKEPS